MDSDENWVTFVLLACTALAGERILDFGKGGGSDKYIHNWGPPPVTASRFYAIAFI